MIFLLFISFFASTNENLTGNLFLGYLKHSNSLTQIYDLNQTHGYCNNIHLLVTTAKNLRGLIHEFDSRLPDHFEIKKCWATVYNEAYQAILLSPADRSSRFDTLANQNILFYEIMRQCALEEWLSLKKDDKNDLKKIMNQAVNVTSKYPEFSSNKSINFPERIALGQFCLTHGVIEFLNHLIKEHQLTESMQELNIQ